MNKETQNKELSTDKALHIADVSHSMTGDGMNCLEFFDMIKKEWCVSEEQYKPFWNDVLTFARKYHKERKEYCGERITAMKRCRVKRPNFQIKNKMNKENKTSDKHEHGNDFIADVSGSVTYQGVTYNWGDKVVSPNGYEFFVVTDDGRWGLVDHGGTFCELQHCDLTGYLHCH